MNGYFQSQVGKMVPEHKHDYEPKAILRDTSLKTGLAKSVPTVDVCRVCGAKRS